MMSEEIQRSGTYAPPVTPLEPGSPTDRLDKCLDSYASSVSEIEKYSTLIIARDIQRDCEGKSSSQYKLMIWQAALNLNKCAIKEAIMCMIPLAVEVATGKCLPAEISQLIYDLLFSNKEWISHQLRNEEKGEHDHNFFNPAKRGQVCIEGIVEREQKKKRCAPEVDGPQRSLRRSWRAQKCRYSPGVLDRNERATINSPAEMSISPLAMKAAESHQSLLDVPGEVASSSSTHALGIAGTQEVSCPTEETEGRSTTALNSVHRFESSNSRSDHSTPLSHCHPSFATNHCVIYAGQRNPMPDNEDEGLWFITESPDLYFKTGIEI